MHQAAAQDDGWLAPITRTLDYTLQQIQTGLDQLHVPYSYGWAIIGLTVATKIATFPFTKIQVQGAHQGMQSQLLDTFCVPALPTQGLLPRVPWNFPLGSVS